MATDATAARQRWETRGFWRKNWDFGGIVPQKHFFSERMFTSKVVSSVLLKFVEIAFVKILRRHKKEP